MQQQVSFAMPSRSAQAPRCGQATPLLAAPQVSACPQDAEARSAGASVRAFARVDAPFPSGLVRVFGTGQGTLLRECTFLGGGTDGFVLLHRPSEQAHSRQPVVLKVREMFTAADRRCVAGEAMLNTLMSTTNEPFVAHMRSFRLWVGEDRPPARSNVAAAVNARLGRVASTHPDATIEFVDCIENPAVRDSIMRHWCESHAPLCRETAPLMRQRQSVQDVYIKMRAEFLLLPRSPEPGPQQQRQVFGLLEQENCGDLNLYKFVASHGGSTPQHFEQLRASFLVLMHMLYAMQRRLGYRHNDLHPNNVMLVYMPSPSLPRAYRKMTLPFVERPFRQPHAPRQLLYRRVRASDLNNRVPVLIDLALSSVSPSALEKHSAATREMAEDAVTRRMLCRASVVSRTADVRRMGVYFAFFAVTTCVFHMDKLAPSASACTTFLAARLDWRFLCATMALLHVPRDWLVLLAPTTTTTTLRDRGTGPADVNFEAPEETGQRRKTKTLRDFVRKLVDTQLFLQSMLAFVHPATRHQSNEGHHAHVVKHAARIKQYTQEFIIDLNAFMWYTIAVCQCIERTDNPCLPENVLRWDVWTQPA